VFSIYLINLYSNNSITNFNQVSMLTMHANITLLNTFHSFMRGYFTFI
jgi:hypothetical protein